MENPKEVNNKSNAVSLLVKAWHDVAKIVTNTGSVTNACLIEVFGLCLISPVSVAIAMQWQGSSLGKGNSTQNHMRKRIFKQTSSFFTLVLSLEIELRSVNVRSFCLVRLTGTSDGGCKACCRTYQTNRFLPALLMSSRSLLAGLSSNLGLRATHCVILLHPQHPNQEILELPQSQ